MLAAALERLGAEGVRVIAAAPVLLTEPLGPSLRRYANSAAVIETRLDPPALLALLKRIEREFGRRRGGRRWTARVLDLAAAARHRASWGFFRDRRPQLYGRICEDI